MSDIAAQPFINYGLSQAQQAQASASANYQNQLSQGAAIQNATAALSYQVRRNAIMSMFGQAGGNGSLQFNSGAAGNSGVGGPSAPSYNPGAGAAGSDYNSASSDSGTDFDYGNSVANPGSLEATLRQRYLVNPAGTPQEQQAIAYGALSGDEGVKQAAIYQRDMNVASRTYMAQQDARNQFDAMNSVVTADPDQTWGVFQSVAPTAANQILRANPQDPSESDDEYASRLGSIAHDTAAHYAAAVHQFTGRELSPPDAAGVYHDKDTGLAVPVPVVGMSKDQYDAAWSKVNTLVDVPDDQGHVHKIAQYKIDGFKTAAADIETQWRQQQALASMPSHPAFAGTPMAQPGTTATQADANRVLAYHGYQPGQPAPAQPAQAGVGQPGQPAAAQPGAPGGGGLAPVAVTAQRLGQPGALAPGAGQPAPGQPGAQPGQRPDNGLLPGVNPDALPKVQTAPARMGVSQSPADAATATGIATERLTQLKDSNAQYVEDQKQGALIRAAQREAAALANNPRMAGPGSEFAQGIAKIKTVVSGQPPDALVDLGSLDKMLMQMGAQSIRNALSGQRITNQEFMAMLTKGNPNTEQPVATIQRLLGYIGTQNDYDQRFQRTKTVALNRGADPMTVDTDIGSIADRGDYVEQRVGIRPPLQPGGGNVGGATQLPTRNAQGWVLHQDAQGRRAYVGPNGQIQTVQ